MLGLALLLIGGRIVLPIFHPPAKTTLVVSKPTLNAAMTVTAPDERGRSRIHGRPLDLTLRGTQEESSVPPAFGPRRVTVSLPVAAPACARLALELDGSCGSGAQAPFQAASALTVEWPRAGEVSIVTDEMSRFSGSRTAVSSNPVPETTWNFELDSAVASLELECGEDSGYRFVFKGHVLRERCIYGSPVLSLSLLFTERRVPAFSLSGLRSVYILAEGQETGLWVDRAELFVGEGESDLRGRRVPIAISSEQDRDLRMEVDDNGGEGESNVTVSTQAAKSVEVDGDQKLPSLLSEIADYWFVALGLLGGIILTILLERLPGHK